MRWKTQKEKRDVQMERLPYWEDRVSKSTLNQWSRDQQLTLTKGHLEVAHLKPKTYRGAVLKLMVKIKHN